MSKRMVCSGVNEKLEIAFVSVATGRDRTEDLDIAHVMGIDHAPDGFKVIYYRVDAFT